MIRILLVVVATLVPNLAQAQVQMWVTSDVLNRRTCASEQCGVVGRLFFRESVTVLEQADGWVRITQYYDAQCRNGASAYVDRGNAICSPTNGIVDGRFAEWVSAQYLGDQQPPDPAAGVQGTAKLVAASDDYRLHKDAFIRAAETLIQTGQCSPQDFIDEGGWIKSTGANIDQPVYFTYCRSGQQRIYLNAITGKISR